MTRDQQTIFDKKRTNPPNSFRVSNNAPQWMKVIENPNIKYCNVKNAPGFNGTVEILSAING